MNYGRICLKTKTGSNKLYWHISEMPPHVIIKLKHMFSSIADSEIQPIRLSASNENACDIEWFMFRYPLNISEKDKRELLRMANTHREKQQQNFDIINGSYNPPEVIGIKEPYELAPFQKQAAALFNNVDKLLIADEIGLGKTVEAIACLMDKKTLPALIVVQPHLTAQWEDEVKKFTNLSVQVIESGKVSPIQRTDIVIIKYTTIIKWIDVLVNYGFQTLVMDEVQEIRNPGTKKYIGCYRLSQCVNYIVALSGTPVVNYGVDIFHLYSVINPKIFPSFLEFKREWLTGYGERVVKNPDALGSYLQEQCAYIRRTKEEVGYQLKRPNKIIQPVSFDNDAIDDMKERARVLALSVLQGEFVERGKAARDLSIMVRKATGISKAKYIAEFTKMILMSGEKVLLGLWHREVYKIVEEALKDFNPVLYSGSETLSKKLKAKEAFINGNSQVMLISLKSGVGLDGLQYCCNNVIIGELDWTNAVHDQLIGRLYRRGQTKQVNAIFLTSDSGSDPLVIDIIGIKKDQSEGIMNPFGKKVDPTNDTSIIKEYARQLLNT